MTPKESALFTAGLIVDAIGELGRAPHQHSGPAFWVGIAGWLLMSAAIGLNFDRRWKQRILQRSTPAMG